MEIGAWGDSITYGAGDTDALGWTGRLRRAFYEQEYSVYNRGICGDSTEDIKKRFEIELDSIKPDLAILAVGMNDSKFPNGGPENKVEYDLFQKNIDSLISTAQAKVNRVLILGLTEVNEDAIEGTSIFKNAVIRKYDAYLKEASTRSGIDFISMQSVLNVNSDLEDGLHPNAAGYEKMFRVILPFIR